VYHVKDPVAIGATNPSYLVAEVTLTLYVCLVDHCHVHVCGVATSMHAAYTSTADTA
jgi:hypothetical protein